MKKLIIIISLLFTTNLFAQDVGYSSSGGGSSSTTTVVVDSARSYITCPADKPPNSPSSLNDEFNSTSVDTVKWKWNGRVTKCVLSSKAGIAAFSDTSVDANWKVRALLQKITDTVWTITAKMTSNSLPFAQWTASGLIVLDSVTGKLAIWGPASRSTGNNTQFTRMASLTSFNDAPLIQADGYGYTTPSYYRLEKTATKKLNAYVSADGIFWRLAWTENSTDYIETAGNKIDKVGFGVDVSYTGSVTLTTWWWRYNWISDFNIATDK
jgi:hypothetical protein